LYLFAVEKRHRRTRKLEPLFEESLPMKKIVALTAALSFLTATAAFATEVPAAAKAPEKTMEHKAPVHKAVEKKAEHKKIEHKKVEKKAPEHKVMEKKSEMKKPVEKKAEPAA
jgi:hypothetical protein